MNYGRSVERTIDVIKTGVFALSWDKFWRKPVYCQIGNRHIHSMSLIRASLRNVGTLYMMLRENPISEIHEGGKYRCVYEGRIIP